MSGTVFEVGYAAAFKIARFRVTAAIRTQAVSSADRDDLVQELLIAVWLASDKFNPARASLRTFFERVIASRLMSTIRTTRRRPPMQPLDLATVGGMATDATSFELRLDIARLLRQLDSTDRRVAVALAQFSPMDASRKLGLGRSTVYRHIGKLRASFAAAGITPQQLGHIRSHQ